MREPRDDDNPGSFSIQSAGPWAVVESLLTLGNFFLSERLGLALFEPVVLATSLSLGSVLVIVLLGAAVFLSDNVSEVRKGDNASGGRCVWSESCLLLRFNVFLISLVPALGGSVLPSS